MQLGLSLQDKKGELNAGEICAGRAQINTRLVCLYNNRRSSVVCFESKAALSKMKMPKLRIHSGKPRVFLQVHANINSQFLLLLLDVSEYIGASALGKDGSGADHPRSALCFVFEMCETLGIEFQIFPRTGYFPVLIFCSSENVT